MPPPPPSATGGGRTVIDIDDIRQPTTRPLPDRQEDVRQWLAISLTAILALDWKKVEAAGYAAAHLARMTGDRTRDVNEELRADILRRLVASGAPSNWIAMVRELVQLDQADEKRMLGEALPPGLKLIA